MNQFSLNSLTQSFPSLSDVRQPLRRLLDQDAFWTWSPDQEAAITHLEELVTNHLILKYNSVNKEVARQGDASGMGCGHYFSKRDSW